MTSVATATCRKQFQFLQVVFNNETRSLVLAFYKVPNSRLDNARLTRSLKVTNEDELRMAVQERSRIYFTPKNPVRNYFKIKLLSHSFLCSNFRLVA